MASAIVTKRFRINRAKDFKDSLSGNDPTILYLFIGRTTAFANDASPPVPTDTIQITEFDAYRDMIAMKRVQASDVSQAILRYNWTSGTVYKQYSDTDTALFPTVAIPTSNTTFYVITEDNSVYKCIDNNRNSPSTTQPTGTSSSIISTDDGYRWKFMFKITAAEALKFLTTNYIPVKNISANDGSAQWAVQQAAANGSLNMIQITANGSGYPYTTNTGFTSVTNSTVVTLGDNASGTDKIYNNSLLYISSGLGAGQLRRIVQYVGTTRTATVNGAFINTPNTTSGYIVGPNVIIKGDSGGIQATRATAYVSNCYGGQIRKIDLVSNGLHYSTANVTIQSNSVYGSGAMAIPIISPPGGHGSAAADELGATSIMLNVKITGNESNTFPTNNDFRMIGLLRNPLLRSGPSANASVIDQCTRLTVTGMTGELTADELIIGGSSGASGRFVRFANTNASKTEGIARLIRVTTNGIGIGFIPGETISGQTSGKTGMVSSVDKPAIREYTGDVIYNENRSPITRTTDQIEDIKLILKW